MNTTDDATCEAIADNRPMTFLGTLAAEKARFRHAVTCFNDDLMAELRCMAIGSGSGE